MRTCLTSVFLLLLANPSFAQSTNETSVLPLMLGLFFGVVLLVALMLWIVLKVRSLLSGRDAKPVDNAAVEAYLQSMDTNEITVLLAARKSKSKTKSDHSSLDKKLLMLLPALFLVDPLLAQAKEATEVSLWSQPGIIITFVLILIPLFIAAVLLIVKINRMVTRYRYTVKEKEAQRVADYLMAREGADVDASLAKRKDALDYHLTNNELSGTTTPDDSKGLLQVAGNNSALHFVATKKRAVKRPGIDPQLSKVILWYLGTAIFWLVFGTSVGEYLGIKFVSPDVDQISWLSFGRLRPVHTNAVFWGWSSLAMIGLGLYIVSVVGNASIASVKKGWLALVCINAAVALGTVSLMAGINNGGGEYREYVWPIMALFGIGIAVTLINFIQTIAKRTTHEIYISNWYMVSALIFTLVIAFIAYWPTWQNGLGETIVQGYYMHQGVGMWFMLFTLGIVYYFLPQQLNKPIYSYSLGILAFWTQILFYTVIGTHHFVFSSIPWWLQTVAIVGSMGMLIPVLAGTTNFLMTFKGDWNKITSSYTLPFFIVGVVFYFTGSFQGTAEAFRYTNLLWHFTDFTVAHSHITMYGIIAFLLWGSIYAVVPRLTGNEPSQLRVGIHFWLAFLGLMFYSIPLMIGGTLKGLLRMGDKPFIEGVVMMAPYWLWRAIGGSMMWLSHLFFAYNFYKMIVGDQEPDIKKMVFKNIAQATATENETLTTNQNTHGNIQ